MSCLWHGREQPVEHGAATLAIPTRLSARQRRSPKGMNLSLSDAFAKFGAKPSNRLRGLSAMAADGALVLNCSLAYFGHPSRGVLRYEDRLSRQSPGCSAAE